MPGRAVRRVTSRIHSFRAAALCLLCASHISAATFVVSVINDAGPGSLRQAILDANTEPGPDIIAFQIPGTGIHTISPLSILPPLLESVVLDGATQPDYAGLPLIELNGVGAGNNSGLRILGGDCTVRGLAINRFGASGIQIEGPGHNLVHGCFLGTDPLGTSAQPNGLEGVWVYNSSGNIIGGTNTLERNLVSGNNDSGIYIQNGSSNWIAGNLIGTIAAGTGILPNRNNGVVIYSAAGNLVGGAVPGARNLISGNGASGVYVLGSGATLNRVQGNYIGLSVSGEGALGNAADGITLSGVGGNQVGGSGSGEGNVVSGNAKAGVAIGGVAATLNSVEGNFIGTSASGTAAVGNGYAGVWLSGGVSNRIGAPVAGGRNIVSGNAQDGVLLSTNSLWNEVLGNFIGLDVTGTATLSNAYSGISVASAHSNTIGGFGFSARNAISGNALYGIYVAVGSSGNAVRGNFIGPDTSGTRELGNGRSGVRLESPGNVVGPGNLISANALDGVVLAGAGASNNVVLGNSIGTDAAGTAPLPNGRAGIGISAAPRNTIGGWGLGAGNLLSANRDAGIYLVDPAATGNQILGNRIGTDTSGAAALGNALEGIYLEGAIGNVIGSVLPGGANVVGGNRARGIYLTNASWNLIQGNFIGTAAGGVAPLPNVFHNFDLEAGATNNTLVANRIAFAPAPYCGIRIRAGSVNNRLDRNSVFANGALGIDLGPAGIASNDLCDADSGANNLQNYPVLTAAIGGAGTAVAGVLSSAASQPFVLQFFASAASDPSGYGEGDLYLGQLTVVTDAACRGAFCAIFPTNIPAGWFLTATATDSAGNTSELSAGVPVQAAPGLILDPVASRDGQLTLSWTNSPAGFVLKQADSLAAPISWSTVTNTASLNNGLFRITLSAGTAATRFYTLQFQPAP